MNPFPLLGSVEALRKQRMIFLSCCQHFGLCGIYTGFCSKKMAEMLPKSCIVIIFARWELGYTKRFIRVYHTGFRSCATQ